MDATDRPQIEELLTLGELVKRAREAGVQVMVEGPGHVPLDQIEMNMQASRSASATARRSTSSGPLVTDIAPGYDHIVAAIGGRRRRGGRGRFPLLRHAGGAPRPAHRRRRPRGAHRLEDRRPRGRHRQGRPRGARARPRARPGPQAARLGGASGASPSTRSSSRPCGKRRKTTSRGLLHVRRILRHAHRQRVPRRRGEGRWRLRLRGLLFGTAGVPSRQPTTSDLSGIERIVRPRPRLPGDRVRQRRQDGPGHGRARSASGGRGRDVRLSVHAPYFINLNSENRGKRLQSQERLLKTARVGRTPAGRRASSSTPRFYGKDTPEADLRRRQGGARRGPVHPPVASAWPITLRVETMGKRSQFGSLDEVLTLCRDVDGLQPCLDFSHLYAREGRVNSYDGFRSASCARSSSKLGPRSP